MSDRGSPRETEIVEFIRSIDEPAPERLRLRVAELAAGSARSSDAAGRAPRPRRLSGSALALRVSLAGGGLVAVVVVAVVLALGGGGSSGSGGLSLSDAMALTLRPATQAAPAENTSERAQLDAGVEGIPFPYWGGRFGWRTSGSRRDAVDGRTVQTVFYDNAQGQRIGYAIVAGSPAPAIATGTGVVRWRRDRPYRLLSRDGVSYVTWLRDGRRCVVSGRGVAASTLLRLASWDDRPTSS